MGFHFDPTPGFNLGISDAFRSVIPSFGVQNGNQVVTSHQAAQKTSSLNNSNSAPNYPQQVRGASTVAPQPVANSGGYSGGAGGGQPAPASQWTPNDEAAYNQAVASANAGLGRLPTQLDIANHNIFDQRAQKFNQLQSGLNQARDNYGTGVTQNQQQHLGNTNQINQQANTSLHSLLRMLGGMGAGGGSEARYVAPQLVGKQAAVQLGGANQTYSQNAQNLDKTWNNYQNDEKTQEQQLNDWELQQVNQAKAQSDQSRQGILQQLANLAAQRAQAMGGSGVAEQQPYINQINQLASEVDQLGRFSPSFSGTTPVYNAPELSSYTLDPAAQAEVQNQAQQAGSSTPYLSLLAAQRRDQQQPIYA